MRTEKNAAEFYGDATTDRSLKAAKDLLVVLGKPEWLSMDIDTDNAEWETRLVWRKDCRRVVARFEGFSTGYYGEGPHGLQELFAACGITIGIDLIAGWHGQLHLSVHIETGKFVIANQVFYITTKGEANEGVRS